MGAISMSVILTEWFWISSVSYLLEFRVTGQFSGTYDLTLVRIWTLRLFL